ncbi:MAG: DUF2953 domain-containing protein [Rhodobacter sp.]|nr:DUF2953 domain-containing protein [Rhodobacter sp.]
MSVLGALLWLIVGLAAVAIAALAALLLLPVQLWVQAASDPAHLLVRLRLFGGALPWIRVIDSDRPGRGGSVEPRAAEAEQLLEEEAPAPAARLSRRRMWRMLRAVPALLQGLAGPVRLERLWLEARLGLDDPAETGQLFGALTPLVYGLGGAWPGRVSLQLAPEFSGPVLEGRGEVILSVVPVRWFGPGLRFAWAGFGPEPRPAKRVGRRPAGGRTA